MKPHSRYFACATILRTSFPAIRPFPDPRRVLGLFPHDAQDVYKRQPWDDQQSAVSAVKDLPIDASLKDKILYENAAGLLKLE